MEIFVTALAKASTLPRHAMIKLLVRFPEMNVTSMYVRLAASGLTLLPAERSQLP